MGGGQFHLKIQKTTRTREHGKKRPFQKGPNAPPRTEHSLSLKPWKPGKAGGHKNWKNLLSINIGRKNRWGQSEGARGKHSSIGGVNLNNECWNVGRIPRKEKRGKKGGLAFHRVKLMTGKQKDFCSINNREEGGGKGGRGIGNQHTFGLIYAFPRLQKGG